MPYSCLPAGISWTRRSASMHTGTRAVLRKELNLLQEPKCRRLRTQAYLASMQASRPQSAEGP